MNSLLETHYVLNQDLQHLDETAVFGSICRHEFPQRFLSMKHGERSVKEIFSFDTHVYHSPG